MKIRHLYDEKDGMIRQHVEMLGTQTTGDDADIVHVHGCWQYQPVHQALQARHKGARIVLTPHGALEPWIIRERRLSEKLSKTILWQRRLVESSYVVIAQGKMEAESLRQLGWNPRIEIIRNAVITNSITTEAMARHTQDIYNKVMDSNTLELMDDDTRQVMTQLLKAGITGDRRWATDRVPVLDEIQWRRLLIYADHENVRTTIDKGCHVLGLQLPYIETAQIKSYLPTGYQSPKPTAHDVAGLINEMHRQGVTLRHLVELDRSLRRPDVDDEQICDMLDEHHLLKYLRRCLQVLKEQTGIDEGFMPAEPLDDRRTQTLRILLTNHLRI